MRTILAKTLLIALLPTQIFAQNWQLVWSDEFNGTIGNDWVFETGRGGSGWGNNELQYYRQENATVNNGMLVITAKKENYADANYTSARMKTQGIQSWAHGKIEARIQMPSFTGSWPAFWMLGESITSVGWPACGEIDIMEHVNTETQIHGTIHWQDHNYTYANYGGHTSGTDVTQFHVYSIEWDDQYIKWFLDGNQYHEAYIGGGINGTSEFQEDFFILLNFAIGGNWPGFTVDDSQLPAQMKVDYVRVYQDSPTSVDNSQNANDQLEIYPNPIKDVVYIKNWNHFANQNFQVYDLIGKSVFQGSIGGNQLNFSALNSGIYFIVLENGTRQKFSITK